MAERAHLLHRLRALPTLGGEIARAAIEIVVIAAGLAWLDPRGAPLAIALGAGRAAGPVRRRAGGGGARSADAQPRRRAGALLSRRAARAGGGADARRRAGAGARAPRSPARMGRGRAAGARRGADGGGRCRRCSASRWRSACWSASSRAGDGDGRDVGSRDGAAARLLGAVAAGARSGADGAGPADPGAAQPDLASARAARRPRGRCGRRDARGRAPATTAAGDAAGVRVAARRRARGGRRSPDPGGRRARRSRPAKRWRSSARRAPASRAWWGCCSAGTARRPARSASTARRSTAPAIEALRRRTVWIDPAVYLWNRSLADNLAFGLAATPEALGAALDEAELGEVVRRLPEGLGDAARRGGRAGLGRRRAAGAVRARAPARAPAAGDPRRAVPGSVARSAPGAARARARAAGRRRRSSA